MNSNDVLDELGRLSRLLASAHDALKPFALYYDIKCQERLATDALEVPVGDLRDAFDVLKDAGVNYRPDRV